MVGWRWRSWWFAPLNQKVCLSLLCKPVWLLIFGLKLDGEINKLSYAGFVQCLGLLLQYMPAFVLTTVIRLGTFACVANWWWSENGYFASLYFFYYNHVPPTISVPPIWQMLLHERSVPSCQRNNGWDILPCSVGLQRKGGDQTNSVLDVHDESRHLTRYE